MEVIRLKVLEGSPELKGKILILEKQNEESVYFCRRNGIKVIDMWDELKIFKNMNPKNKFKLDTLLIIDSNKSEPQLIHSVQHISTIRKHKKNNKTLLFNFRKILRPQFS